MDDISVSENSKFTTSNNTTANKTQQKISYHTSNGKNGASGSSNINNYNNNTSNLNLLSKKLSYINNDRSTKY